MKLDLGCSDKKREGYMGMDNRILPGVDYVHNLEQIPWPVEDEECELLNASHVLEHIKPWKIFPVMNECWRVLKVGGGIDIRVPFGIAYSLDPSHTIEFSVPSFWYWDNRKPSFKVYNPKPWNIIHEEVNKENQEIRVILQKVEI